MKEITYKIVENLGYDAKDKKQTVIGEITKTEYDLYFKPKNPNELKHFADDFHEGRPYNDENWVVNQYNRNRNSKDHISSSKQIKT